MADVANFRFNDVGARFDRGYERANALRQDRAQMQAGNALIDGDYAGAANALLGSGDLRGGLGLTAYASGLGTAEAKAAEGRQKQVLDYTSEMAGRLSSILDETEDDPGAVVGAFDTFFAPRLQQLGEAPEELAQVRQQLAANPRQTLIALGAAAAKEQGYEIRNAGEEVFIIDPRTGDLVNRYRGARTVPLGEGGALYELPGSYGGIDGRSAPSNDPTGLPPGSGIRTMAPTDGAGDRSAPRSVRNNNPGNIKDGPFAQSLPGYAGTDGTFARFETPDAGQAAQRRLLSSYGERGFNSVKAIIERWAPPSDNNPTRSYIDFVARKLGVSPREQLDMQDPQVIAALGDAITEFEGGSATPAAPQGRYQVASAGATPPPPGEPRLIASRPSAPKEAARPATAEEKARYGIPENVPAQMKPDGTLDVITLPKGVADAEKAKRAIEAQQLKAQDIIKTVGSARSKVSNLTAGFVGGNINSIAGTPAYDLAREIDTIKANLGFQELAAMRAASPTGGALGAIAVQELVALQSTVASLDIGQSPAQLRANLDKIERHYSRWLETVAEEATAGGAGEAPAQEKPAAAPRRMRFDERGNRIG